MARTVVTSKSLWLRSSGYKQDDEGQLQTEWIQFVPAEPIIEQLRKELRFHRARWDALKPVIKMLIGSELQVFYNSQVFVDDLRNSRYYRNDNE